MRALLLALLLGGYNAYKPATPPTLKTPLILTLSQTVGMAPMTLRVKVKAAAEGREVCIVVDGPESTSSCRTLWGVTWVQDFILRSGGDYEVYATSEKYRTVLLPVRVVGLEGEQ